MRRRGPRASARAALGLASFAGLLALDACRYDPAYRDVLPVEAGGAPCTPGRVACDGTRRLVCEDGALVEAEDCAARGETCAESLGACAPCRPGTTRCTGQTVERCADDGRRFVAERACDTGPGLACREGACTSLCQRAARARSNVGCEYWAVDLDNAVTGSGNAAAQQFAVVLSNPEPDLTAHVTVEEDEATPGEPARVRTVATATVFPRGLEVFRLGPKEVDGSVAGTFDTGPGTALSRGAYRITSDVPLVAYQFNPLENANVFSNDASQLLPATALGTPSRYVVASWPQTIARSDVPAQDFGSDLRAFLTLVGTRPDTHVHLKTRAKVVPGGPLPSGLREGQDVDVVLQPFEVLNLETGSFGADFTGSVVEADEPVVVFTGSEASDAPTFSTLAARACCADHLEEQVVPTRAVGTRYVLGHMPNRSRAVALAGAALASVEEPELFRIVATTPGPTTVTTSLPPPADRFVLAAEGSHVTLASLGDVQLSADRPVLVASVQVGQEAAGVPRGLPGGDPSLTLLPPIEQWRPDYVFLTPDKYAFDFVVILAERDAGVFLDGLPVDARTCERSAADGRDETTPVPDGGAPSPYVVYRCQLSFPVIVPGVPLPDGLRPGRQNDGVHRVQSDRPVGVVVYGFDAFVSYAYAGGTDLRELTTN